MMPKEIVEFLIGMSKARAAARAAEVIGDKHAAEHGRTRWNLDDYHAATALFDKMCPATTPEDLMLRAKTDHEATIAMGGTT